MNLDPMSWTRRLRAVRSRTHALRARLGKLLDLDDEQEAPGHGGVQATDGAELHASGDALAQERRRRALATMIALLALPDDADVDMAIRQDPDHQRVVFTVRDRKTGAALREIPESDLPTLRATLRGLLGCFVDRSA